MEFSASGLPENKELEKHWDRALKRFENGFSTEKKAHRAFVSGPLSVARFIQSLPLEQDDRIEALKLALNLPITGRFDRPFSEEFVPGVQKGQELDEVETIVLKAGAIACLNLMQADYYRQKPIGQRSGDYTHIVKTVTSLKSTGIVELEDVLEDLMERQEDLQYFDSLPETNCMRRRGLRTGTPKGSMPV